MSNSASHVKGAFTRLSAFLPAPEISLLPVRHRQQQQLLTPVFNPYREEETLLHLGKRIITSLEDRWGIWGTTGSGKTTLVKELLKRLQTAYPAARTYILDTKQSGDFDDLDALRMPDEIPPDPLRTPGASMVWAPPDEDLEAFDRWFKKILHHRQPAILVVDELSTILNAAGQGPLYFNRLLKLGRSLGISVISVSQEAAYIPRNVLGQTTHVVRMRLLNEHDGKKLDKIIGRPADEHGKPISDRYGFYHRRTDTPNAGHYYRKHQEFF